MRAGPLTTALLALPALALPALMAQAPCLADEVGLADEAAPAHEPGQADEARLGLVGGGPAHLFDLDEPVRFVVSGGAVPGGDGRARWTLADWQGTVLARGELAHAAGGRIELLLDRQGYFELTVSLAGRPDIAATAAFARLPRMVPRPDGAFGVMAHFAQGWELDLVPLMARIGLGRVRDEQYWADVEPEPGRFVFPAGYVAYMAALRRAGIAPLIEMTFANPHYDGGATPVSPAAQQAFARYGAALLDAFGDQVAAVEVWNEINGTWCDGACRDDRAGTYAGMLVASWNLVKPSHPAVTIAGGGSAAIALPWFRKLAERGILAHLDVLAAHSYVREPEDVLPELAGLAALARERSPEHPLPIWITETGIAGARDDAAGRRQTAAWLVRLLTALRAGGAARAYWYLLRDDGQFQGMGLLRGPDSFYGRHAPNPAYAAYATLLRLLDGAAYVRRDPADPRTQAHLFAADGRSVRVLWSTAGSARLDFRAQAPVELVDLMGNATRLVPRAGRVSVELDEVPRYLVGAATLDSERRADLLLADSRLDFATVPDHGAWSYGYRHQDGQGRLGELQPLVPAEDDWRAGWAIRTDGRLALGRDQAHPAGDGAAQDWIVRRWRSNIGGTVRLSGVLERDDPRGDGVEVRLLIDGVERQRWPLAPGARTGYALDAVLQPDSLVDLVVTPGPAGDDGFDATVTTLSVTAPSLDRVALP